MRSKCFGTSKMFRKSFFCEAPTFRIKIGEGITKGYYFYCKNVLGWLKKILSLKLVPNIYLRTTFSLPFKLKQNWKYFQTRRGLIVIFITLRTLQIRFVWQILQNFWLMYQEMRICYVKLVWTRKYSGKVK